MTIKKVVTAGITIASLLLAGCGAQNQSSQANETVKVGVVSDVEREVWEDVAKRVKEDGVDLEVVPFSDYVQPNDALAHGDIDLNAFQHVAFLEEYNEERQGDLAVLGFTYISPLALYSDKVKAVEELKEGARIAIPNDVTNGGRALRLLQAAGLIELADDKLNPGLADIKANKHKLKIEEIDAAQVARSLPDVDAAVINTNFATDSGLSPAKDGLFVDTDHIKEVADIYKNVMAVKRADKDKPVLAKIVKAYQSKATAERLAEVTDHNDVPAW